MSDRLPSAQAHDTEFLTQSSQDETVREWAAGPASEGQGPAVNDASSANPPASPSSSDSLASARYATVQNRHASIEEALEHVVTSEPAGGDGSPDAQAGLESQVRRDVLTGRQTIFAAARGQRPVEFAASHTRVSGFEQCPFCCGNEALTPAPTLQIDHEEDPATWLVRVVPNKYPAVRSATGTQTVFPERSRGTLFPQMPVAGGHEVIIESPEHAISVSELNVTQLASSYRAIAQRIAHWRQIPNIEYVSVFKNVGAPAGASLSHTHSQLLATAMMPPRVRDLVYRMGKHYDLTGCCLQCDLMRAEIEAEPRVVLKTEHFVAYCPFASPMPYMVRVVPLRHLDCFDEADANVLEDLANISRRLVQCYETLFPGTAYNSLLHTRPPGVSPNAVFHWNMEWFPRVTTQAGFEFSSDCFINPTLPETAASRLRAVVRRLNPLRPFAPRNDYSASEV